MKFLIPLLAMTITLSFGQSVPSPGLRGLDTVSVQIAWVNGTPIDKTKLQTDIELKLRQTGIRVVSAEEQAVGRCPIFYIAIGLSGPSSVLVELSEEAYTERSFATAAVPKLPDPQFVATWMRIGIANTSETVRQIIERYKKASAPYILRPPEEHMMDLEVQAAMELAKNGRKCSRYRKRLR